MLLVGIASGDRWVLAAIAATAACCLQVVDGPDSKTNRQDHSAERKDQNRCITTVESRSNSVSNFLGITTTRSRALGATETLPLLFKEHSGAFGLTVFEKKKKQKSERLVRYKRSKEQTSQLQEA
jgi:hypothetical protein